MAELLERWNGLLLTTVNLTPVITTVINLHV